MSGPIRVELHADDLEALGRASLLEADSRARPTPFEARAAGRALLDAQAVERSGYEDRQAELRQLVPALLDGRATDRQVQIALARIVEWMVRRGEP